MFKLCAKTKIRCFFCRSTFVVEENKFIFPVVWDFCPACEKKVNDEHARQLRGDPSVHFRHRPARRS